MPESESPRVVFEVTGSGPHYVWNEDRTGLVAKDGEIDGSQPWFIIPAESEPCTQFPCVGRAAEWPDGWVDVGATEEGYSWTGHGPA